jgi:hypothetical protein
MNPDLRSGGDTMQSSLRAITIWQPWASLIIIGAKPYEFRDRSYLAYINHPQPGERIAIHASARPVRPAEVKDLLFRIGRTEDTTGLIVERAAQLLDRVRAAHRCRVFSVQFSERPSSAHRAPPKTFSAIPRTLAHRKTPIAVSLTGPGPSPTSRNLMCLSPPGGSRAFGSGRRHSLCQ